MTVCHCVNVYWCFEPFSSWSGTLGLLNPNNEGTTSLILQLSLDTASHLKRPQQHRYKNLQSQRSSTNCSLFYCVHTAMVAAQKLLVSLLLMIAMTAPSPLHCQCSWFLSLLGLSLGPSLSRCLPFWLWLQSFCTVASDTLLTLQINTRTCTWMHSHVQSFVF